MKYLNQFLVSLLTVNLLLFQVPAQGNSTIPKKFEQLVKTIFGKNSTKLVIAKNTKETLRIIKQKLIKVESMHGAKALGFSERHGYDGLHLLGMVGKVEGKKIIAFSDKIGVKSWRVLGNQKKRTVFLEHGEEIGEGMIRFAKPTIDTIDMLGEYGVKAAKAYRTFNKLKNGAHYFSIIKDIPKKLINDISDIVIKYGDPAVEFLWKHREDIISTTALAAVFIANPDPYINGELILKNEE